MRNLFDLATQLLGLVVDGFGQAGVALPEIRYVAPGSTVAFDGPQITVNLTEIGYGAPGAGSGIAAPHVEEFTAHLLVSIVRDTPMVSDDGTPPGVADLIASAEENMRDVITLTDVLRQIRSGCMPGQHGLVDSPWLIAIRSATPVGPEGGVAAAVAPVEVSLV